MRLNVKMEIMTFSVAQLGYLILYNFPYFNSRQQFQNTSVPSGVGHFHSDSFVYSVVAVMSVFVFRLRSWNKNRSVDRVGHY